MRYLGRRQQQSLVIVARNRAIALQDGHCLWCDCRMLPPSKVGNPRAATAEHIIPRSWGGSDDVSNVVAACLACNNARGDFAHDVRALLALVVIGAIRGEIMSGGTADPRGSVYRFGEGGTVIQAPINPSYAERAKALECAAKVADFGEATSVTLARADAFARWLAG